MPGSSRLNWPNQGNPPPADWKLWRQALRKCFLTTRNEVRLLTPLGSWTLPAPAHWPCWYDVTDHSAYIKEEGQWRKYTATHQGLQLQPRFIRHTLHAYLPPNSLQAIGWLTADILTFTGRARGTAQPTVRHTSLDDVTAAYDPSLQWALNYVQMPDNLTPIADSIRDGTAAAVTDGSFKLQRGTSAFILLDLASGI
jgi:hypothetical protein